VSAEPFTRLAEALNHHEVRYVLIGVWGANLWARSGATIFTTEDFDLFLPPDPANALRSWTASETVGLRLFCDDEPLDRPRDEFLAGAIVSRRALVRATDSVGLDVDLTLVMAGFEFEAVWAERRLFVVEGVEVPVARLTHIVQSKAAAGRPKGRLFLASHEEALRDLIARESES
jgi:hypothetical protein